MLKIFRPIRSNWLTQKFGESLACVKTTLDGFPIRPFIVKSKQGFTCLVGYKDFYLAIGMKGHNGIDIACYRGAPIYFPVDADCKWWTRNYTDMDGGMGVDIFSDRPIDIGELPPEAGKLARAEYEKYKGKVYVKFRFHHISKSLVSDSKNNESGHEEGYRECNVRFGQLIALAGNTGASSGPHLHWGMKIVSNNSMTLDNDNGYYGAVNFEPYFTNKFILDEIYDRINPEGYSNIANSWKQVLLQLQQFISNLKK